MIGRRAAGPVTADSAEAMKVLLMCLLDYADGRKARGGRRRTAGRKAEPVPPTGIGVARPAILSLFTRTASGWQFGDAPPVQGQPRTIGTSPDGVATIELLGPVSDLRQVAFMVQAGRSPRWRLLEEMTRLAGLLESATAVSGADADWVYAMVMIAFQRGAARAVRGRVEMELAAQRLAGRGTMTLIIRGR